MYFLAQPAFIGSPAIAARDIAKQWAIVQHWVLMPDSPPDLIFVTQTRISNIFTMPEAFANSEWMKRTQQGTIPVLIGVVALCDDIADASKAKAHHISSLATVPICNLIGHSTMRQQGAIVSSDGRTFSNQLAAAQALGVTQAAISHVLSGRSKTVKGIRLHRA